MSRVGTPSGAPLLCVLGLHKDDWLVKNTGHIAVVCLKCGREKA